MTFYFLLVFLSMVNAVTSIDSIVYNCTWLDFKSRVYRSMRETSESQTAEELQSIEKDVVLQFRMEIIELMMVLEPKPINSSSRLSGNVESRIPIQTLFVFIRPGGLRFTNRALDPSLLKVYGEPSTESKV
jgi:hypothetical protein